MPRRRVGAPPLGSVSSRGRGRLIVGLVPRLLRGRQVFVDILILALCSTSGMVFSCSSETASTTALAPTSAPFPSVFGHLTWRIRFLQVARNQMVIRPWRTSSYMVIKITGERALHA
ncbi:hypothetical protein EYF80_038854 [Liparis tanakae]|uniref:Uncharacterized protein n=1 Tax=Liparis tanakae TaxID=230148 RepID=A0A4Z2GCF5_9TELE|nr:hypothetical protein EYF80_038854 [Liparis tanakae]